LSCLIAARSKCQIRWTDHQRFKAAHSLASQNCQTMICRAARVLEIALKVISANRVVSCRSYAVQCGKML